MKKVQQSEKSTEMENSKGGELLSTQISEEKLDKVDYSKLVEQEEMDGYPVMMTRMRNSQQEDWGGWFGMIGMAKVTPDFENKEGLEAHFNECGIKAEFMSTLINVIAAHIEAIKEFNNNK